MTTTTVRSLAELSDVEPYAYLDETSKRAVRRAVLKALCIPGHQVPFAAREMPVARGWGSGGLQVTLSLVGPDDVVKVIDQGSDDSLNAVQMKDLIATTSRCGTTTRTSEATLIQSRHRLPEVPMSAEQILVLQLPNPEPLRRVEPDEVTCGRLHADRDYTAAWLDLFDDELRLGEPLSGADHPVLVEGGALMSPSPIPRYDVLRLGNRPHATILGAGRRARLTALPPHTTVAPLAFDDRPLRAERADGPCERCGSTSSFRVEAEPGTDRWSCTDVDACRERTA
jgi:alpha-D-ribose 1-methylphosphonate 5-phosphate C-P lyase